MYHPNLGRWMTIDPVAYQAGDVNLFRYEGNSPQTSLDPSGMEKEPITVGWVQQGFGTTTGVLGWGIAAPKPPEGLKITTHIDIRWSVSDCCDNPAARPMKGSYEFWFLGLVDLSGFKFNLTPFHGSHKGAGNKDEPWPIFSGLTPKEREEQWKEYMRGSFDTLGSCGELTIRVEYRGYKVDPTEQFQNPITNEKPGPVQEPTIFRAPLPVASRGTIIPNWLRFQQKPRELYPWLAQEPAIWSAFTPNWSHVIVMTYKWGGKNATGGVFGSYSVTNGAQPPVSGVTYGPQ